MKKRNILLGVLSLAVLLGSCKKDFIEESTLTSLQSDVNALTFEEDGESQEFKITATDGSAWSIVEGSYEKWVDIKKVGDKVVVTAKKFNGGKRTTEFTVVSGNAKKTYLITQYGAGAILELDGVKKNYFFKKDAETIQIQLRTNTNDWTVQTLDSAPWLEWKRDLENKILKLSVKDFKKTDENFRTSRKTSLYISAGNKHLKLNITQTGWIQFGDPIFFPLETLRSKILEEEAKLGHTRDLEYDKKFWPVGDPGDKQYMAVTNSGEQVGMTIYGFDRGVNNERFDGTIFLRPKEERFDEDVFREAMVYKGFRVGSLPSYNSFFGKATVAYYKEEADNTHIYILYNGDDAKFNNRDKGPFISCKLASNKLEVENGKMTNFPVRNTSRMDDPTYKLEQIIAYEESQGMEVDTDSEFTKLNTAYPAVKYATLAFKPKTPSEDDGTLFAVVYSFNYPGVDETGDSRFLSGEPELAGSFGRCYVIYNGRNYSLDRDGGGFDILKKGVGRLAREKGYDVLRQEFSWITLWRGLSETDITQDKEFIDIGAGRVEGKDKTTFDYYRTKVALKDD